MPLGRRRESKRQIRREETEFFRDEMRSLRVETRDLRADYEGEVSESRLFNRELLIRLEKTYGSLGTTLERMGDRIEMLADQVGGMGVEIHELKGAVDAQTQAILRLVDRFEDSGGRPPV